MSYCPWKHLHFVVEPDIYWDIYLCRKESLLKNSLHFVAFFDFLEQIAQICFFLCRWNKCLNTLYLYYILWYQYGVLEQKLLDAFCSKKNVFFHFFGVFIFFFKKMQFLFLIYQCIYRFIADFLFPGFFLSLMKNILKLFSFLDIYWKTKNVQKWKTQDFCFWRYFLENYFLENYYWIYIIKYKFKKK
jgi:hypothetical protein